MVIVDVELSLIWCQIFVISVCFVPFYFTSTSVVVKLLYRESFLGGVETLDHYYDFSGTKVLPDTPFSTKIRFKFNLLGLYRTAKSSKWRLVCHESKKFKNHWSTSMTTTFSGWERIIAFFFRNNLTELIRICDSRYLLTISTNYCPTPTHFLRYYIFFGTIIVLL